MSRFEIFMTPNSFGLHEASSRLASLAIQFPFGFESKKTPRKKIIPPQESYFLYRKQHTLVRPELHFPDQMSGVALPPPRPPGGCVCGRNG